MKKYRVFLYGKKRGNLDRLVRTSTHKSRTITRARILLLADENPRGITRGMGKTDKEIIGIRVSQLWAKRLEYNMLPACFSGFTNVLNKQASCSTMLTEKLDSTSVGIKLWTPGSRARN